MQSGWVSSERHSETELQFFRHDFQNQRCKHPGIRIFFGGRESGADFFGKPVVDSFQFNQTFEMCLDECGWPLPHVIAGPEAKDVRLSGANHKTILPK